MSVVDTDLLIQTAGYAAYGLIVFIVWKCFYTFFTVHVPTFVETQVRQLLNANQNGPDVNNNRHRIRLHMEAFMVDNTLVFVVTVNQNNRQQDMMMVLVDYNEEDSSISVRTYLAEDVPPPA